MLSDLINEIEDRLRNIVREEIKAALFELENPSANIEDTRRSETKKQTDDLPQLLTAQQVAQILGVSVWRVYELTRQRSTSGIPVVIIGERSYRYNKKSILKWIEKDN